MTAGDPRSAWVEPTAELVAPGIHRIPLPLPNDGLRAVNVYAVQTQDGITLVDGGWSLPESRAQLTASLAQTGAELTDIHQVLVTHMHRDHYTQAVALRRDVGCQVSLGAGERPTLELVNLSGREPFERQIAGLRLHGATALADLIAQHAPSGLDDRSDWALPDRWLTDEPVTLPGGRELDVVPTPGHTTGHVVFHDMAARLLFAGDHVLPTITPSIGFEPIASPDPLGAFLHSLTVIRSRPDALLLPAHGPVAPSAHARVDELIAHHGRRLEQARTAVDQGAASPYEVAQVLTWTRRERAFSDLDPFNAMLAVSETAAHLDLLAAQGDLSVTTEDGVRRYC